MRGPKYVYHQIETVIQLDKSEAAPTRRAVKLGNRCPSGRFFEWAEWGRGVEGARVGSSDLQETAGHFHK